MTDRVKGLTIYFDSFDISEDSEFIENLQKALKCFRHVRCIKPIIVTAEDHYAYDKGYQDAICKVYDFLYENRKLL